LPLLRASAHDFVFRSSFLSRLSSRVLCGVSALRPLRTVLSGYSPLDFTTLDPHWGKRDEWRSLIDAVHARGMYYVVDFTVATMGDLIGWEG
jgi:glycosidase